MTMTTEKNLRIWNKKSAMWQSQTHNMYSMLKRCENDRGGFAKKMHQYLMLILYGKWCRNFTYKILWKRRAIKVSYAKFSWIMMKYYYNNIIIGIHTAKFSKYVWPFPVIIHKRVKTIRKQKSLKSVFYVIFESHLNHHPLFWSRMIKGSCKIHYKKALKISFFFQNRNAHEFPLFEN